LSRKELRKSRGNGWRSSVAGRLPFRSLGVIVDAKGGVEKVSMGLLQVRLYRLWGEKKWQKKRGEGVGGRFQINMECRVVC